MNEEKKEELAESEESGVSIRDIFRIIGKKLWYVFGGAILVTLAAVLIFMFAVNPAKRSKSMEFEINYPASTEEKYPDGSAFNYRDIASRNVVQATIDSDEKFSSLDIDKIMKNQGVSVFAEKIDASENAAYKYKIIIKSYYFGGVDEEDFMIALADEFTKFVVNKAQDLSYRTNVDTFNSASFKDQLSILDEQKTILIEQYDNWIKEYSAGHIVQGKSLGNHRTEVVATFADDVRLPISTSLSTKGYEYFTGNVTGDNVKERVLRLQEEQKLNSAIIQELKKAMESLNGGEISRANSGMRASTFAASDSSGSGDQDKSNIIIMPSSSDLSSRLAYYSERYAIVSQQIVNLTSKSPQKGADVTVDEDTDVKEWNFDDMAREIRDFGTNNLYQQFEKLNMRADTLKSVITAVYGRDTVATFTTEHAKDEGGTSIIIVAVAVFVVSFLVFAVIAYFVGKKEEKGKRKAATESTTIPEEKNEQ